MRNKNIWRGILNPFFPLLLLAGMAVPAGAEESRRTLTVVGRGEAEVKPDTAVVRAVLQVRASSGRQAKERLDALLNELLEAFAESGAARDDIHAESLRLDVEYENFLFSGYNAWRDVAVVVRDLEDIGGVTDLLAGRKEARIHGVFYRSGMADEARRTALRRAVEDSQAQAALIAESYGMTLGKPVSVIYGGRDRGRPGAPAFAQMSSLSRAEADAPFLPDDLSFSETVEAVFEIR